MAPQRMKSWADRLKGAVEVICPVCPSLTVGVRICYFHRSAEEMGTGFKPEKKVRALTRTRSKKENTMIFNKNYHRDMNSGIRALRVAPHLYRA